MCIFKNGLRGFFLGEETLLRLKRFKTTNALGKLQIQQRKGLGKLEGAGYEGTRREGETTPHGASSDPEALKNKNLEKLSKGQLSENDIASRGMMDTGESFVKLKDGTIITSGDYLQAMNSYKGDGGLTMASDKGGVLSSTNNFLEAIDNKINGSGKFETKDQRSLRESEAHQKLIENLAGTDHAIQEKYGSRIASPEQIASHYGSNAEAYGDRFHFLTDANGNITGKILKDSAYENQTDAQFRDRTRGINSSNICSLASSAGLFMSEGIPQHNPGQKFADELAGGFVNRIPSSESQKTSGRITDTFKENATIYSNGAKEGHSQDPTITLTDGRVLGKTDTQTYLNTDKIKSLLDRGIPVMASTRLTSSGHITYIVGYDNSKNTWIVHDPNGDKNRANYGRQEATAGRAVEYGQNTHGIGDRRIYWMEGKSN
ncbi:peptidase C39-like family protein [Leptospira noguchii str. 2007001578]|uniref:Peptidase C39-like family protein n=1 Tax=Leptospira noguchii str. 2007001578 TaxID=1049974 RepID=A0ABN0J0E4_9LEPT|nr:peptidase C39-like family protein [Leptospira noguchii str. 2007001578]